MLRKFDIKNPYTEEEIKKEKKRNSRFRMVLFLVFVVASTILLVLPSLYPEHKFAILLAIVILVILARSVFGGISTLAALEENEYLYRINHMSDNNDVLKYYLLVKERTPPLLEMELQKLENFYEEAKKQAITENIKERLKERAKES
jgi:hypothetical protein